jgi:hypothetical protein
MPSRERPEKTFCDESDGKNHSNLKSKKIESATLRASASRLMLQRPRSACVSDPFQLVGFRVVSQSLPVFSIKDLVGQCSPVLDSDGLAREAGFISLFVVIVRICCWSKNAGQAVNFPRRRFLPEGEYIELPVVGKGSRGRSSERTRASMPPPPGPRARHARCKHRVKASAVAGQGWPSRAESRSSASSTRATGPLPGP